MAAILFKTCKQVIIRIVSSQSFYVNKINRTRGTKCKIFSLSYFISGFFHFYKKFIIGDGSPDGTINLIFHFCFPASTGFICQIFFIGSSRFRSRHRRGKIIVFANSITYPADFVVGAFIGNVFMVICKTGGIKDQMAMNMVLICMGCKHIFIFSFQNRISNFSADFVCKIGIGKLIGVKRNNHMPGKIVSFIHYIIFSHFCSHSKFQISSFGRASKGRDKQLIICLIRICNI